MLDEAVENELFYRVYNMAEVKEISRDHDEEEEEEEENDDEVEDY